MRLSRDNICKLYYERPPPFFTTASCALPPHDASSRTPGGPLQPRKKKDRINRIPLQPPTQNVRHGQRRSSTGSSRWHSHPLSRKEEGKCGTQAIYCGGDGCSRVPGGNDGGRISCSWNPSPWRTNWRNSFQREKWGWIWSLHGFERRRNSIGDWISPKQGWSGSCKCIYTYLVAI